jgi:hypothetical protein
MLNDVTSYVYVISPQGNPKRIEGRSMAQVAEHLPSN